MHFRKMRRLPPLASLNDPIEAGKGDSSLTVQDVLTDPFVLDEDCALRLDSARLRRCVETLDARSRRVLTLRYGLGGQEPLTQSQTAALLSISRSYVSRLESKALRKLKGTFQPEDGPP